MDPRDHVRVTGSALKNWAIAQIQDSIAVAVLWLVGLWILSIPWAPLWALLAAALQVVPHLGPVLSLVGPVLAASLRWQDWEHPLYVLILYAVIVVVDGLVLQPYIMRRVARVPMWPLSWSRLFWDLRSLSGDFCLLRRYWQCCTRTKRGGSRESPNELSS